MKLLLTVFVVLYTTLISSSKSEAQTDLDGVDKKLTATSAFSTSYTNSSDTLAKLTVQLGITSSTNFSGQLTGNLQFVVHLNTNQDNGSRLVLNNASNTFTGGLYIEQGTVRVDNYAYIGGENGRKQIDMLHGSLMTNLDFNGYTINLTGDISNGERGAIRLSGTTGGSTDGGNFDAYITGSGSLEIVNDNPVTLTNTSNDYQGKTYIGSFAWRYTKNANPDPLDEPATLKLGANGVLPDTTVVIFGGDGVGTPTTGIKTLDLCGHNETVAGIFNSDTQGIITSDESATLTIKTKLNESNSYAGIIKDNVSLEITGSGTQTLSGANTYTGTTKISGGTLKLSGDSATLGAGAVTIGETAALEISGAPRGLHSVTSLSGSGDINITVTGNNYLSLANANAQDYSGTINITEPLHIGYRADSKDHSTYLNLPNATVSLTGSGSLALDQDDNHQDTTTLTIKTLNGVAGTYVRAGGQALYSSDDTFSTIVIGEGDFNGVIGTNGDAYFNKISIVKNTSGTLTLSGANTYTGETTVSEGTLKLTGAAVVANSLTTVGANGTLEYNLANNQTERLTIEETNAILSTGTIKKTGDGTLKLYAADEDLINSHSFVVSSGRLDMTKYFKGALTVGEKLSPENYLTAIFSPGNSVGSLDITGDFTLNPGSTLLLEFDETGADSLLVTGTTKFEEGSIITLALDEGASVSPNQQVSFQLPANIGTFDTAQLSYPSYLTGVSYNPTTGVLSATVDANAVPEPSTWALLLLGAAGLLYVRKRKN